MNFWKSSMCGAPAAGLPGRRHIVAAASVLAAFGLASRAVAADAETVDYLLVQTAKGMTFDRPERVAGNMKTSAFIPFWSVGKDSFAKVPPNADVSIIEGDTMRQVIVELQDPALENDILRYKVKILQGEMPEKGADVSVFIDIIGMPRTPISFAGVGRRTWRRAWYR